MAEDFKKLVKEGKAYIGTEQTLTHLKQGWLKKVYLTSNCPAGVKTDVKKYAELTGTEVEELAVPNEELGIMCKKQFSISVLGVKKDVKK